MMELNLTPEVVKNRICENLIQAGVLLQSEVPRYRKTLDIYDSLTLLRTMLVSHELREVSLETGIGQLPAGIPRRQAEKLLPIPPEEGPPLPRGLGLRWPWKNGG